MKAFLEFLFCCTEVALMVFKGKKIETTLGLSVMFFYAFAELSVPLLIAKMEPTRNPTN